MNSDITFVSKAVLTVDIVEFSKRSVTEQMKVTQALIQLLRIAVPEKENHPSRRIWSPAGDGGSMTFWEDTLAAIKTAVTLGKLVNKYNQYIKGQLQLKDVDERLKDDELPTCEESLQIRTGIHSGPVVKQVDFDDRQNIWGYGINIATRVASLAKPGQIVVSEQYYQEADLEYQKEYIINDIGKRWAKHNVPIQLHNVYLEDGSAGISIEEVEEWYTPFQNPLQQVVSTYAIMLKYENVAFRTLVLAKRILDLCPDERQEENQEARKVIKFLSKPDKGEFPEPGAQVLYDPFFSELSLDALLYFCRYTQFKTFTAGQDIYREGEKAHSMMIIVSGEIELYLNEQRISSVILTEGQIIGEMGLFNPAGEKRTATLKAAKNCIALSLDYSFLRPGESPQSSVIEEIRKQIWNSYRYRMKNNQIITLHGLFQALSKEQRKELAKHSEFLPESYDEDIRLTVNDTWESLILVVEGSITVCTTQDNRLTFEKGDCLGTTIRLIVDQSPYSKIEVPLNTHLIRLPWKAIKKFLDESNEESYAEKFYEGFSVKATKIRRKFQRKGK